MSLPKTENSLPIGTCVAGAFILLFLTFLLAIRPTVTVDVSLRRQDRASALPIIPSPCIPIEGFCIQFD